MRKSSHVYRDNGKSRARNQRALRDAVACESLEGRRLLSAGQLATAFGSGGTVIDSTFNSPEGAIVLPGDKIVVASFDKVADSSALVEYDATGTLAAGFGTNGKVDLPTAHVVSALAAGPGGTIVASVFADSGNTIQRFKTDGIPDTTFAGTGSINIGTFFPGHLIAEPDGSVIASGNDDFGVGLVEKFNAAGTVAWSYSSPAQSIDGVGLEPNGDVIIAGQTKSNAAPYILALKPDGTPDASITFQGGLLGQLGDNFNALTIAPDGTVIVAMQGGEFRGGYIAGYSTTGQNTFLTPLPLLGIAADVKVSPSNQIVVSGSAYFVANFFVAQFNLNGTPDTSFGTNGETLAPFDLAVLPSQIGFLSDGSIVATASEGPSLITSLYTDSAASAPTGESPFSGAPIPITSIIQAENFNLGGEGAAYHDTEPANLGGEYRPAEGVDIQSTSDIGGGYNVGWIRNGEFLDYTVSIPTTGSYNFQFRVASPTGGAVIAVAIDKIMAAAVAFPDTGGDQNWQTVSSNANNLTAGIHVIRLGFFGTSYYLGNFNYFTAISTPFSTTPISIPGTIEAENYDLGGEGVAYHDTEPANLGGQYRPSDGVDIQATTDTGGGYNVGWTRAGEYLDYTINVPAAGHYDIASRIASDGQGGTFEYQIDGFPVSDPLGITDTGGWQSWQTLTAPGLSLTAGTHVLRVLMLSNGVTGYTGNFNYFTVMATAAQ